MENQENHLVSFVSHFQDQSFCPEIFGFCALSRVKIMITAIFFCFDENTKQNITDKTLRQHLNSEGTDGRIKKTLGNLSQTNRSY